MLCGARRSERKIVVRGACDMCDDRLALLWRTHVRVLRKDSGHEVACTPRQIDDADIVCDEEQRACLVRHATPGWKHALQPPSACDTPIHDIKEQLAGCGLKDLPFPDLHQQG